MAHKAQGDVDAIADKVHHPRVDIFSDHKESGHGLERRDEAVDKRQVGVEHIGIEEIDADRERCHDEERPDGIAPANGALVVFGLLLPTEDTHNGGDGGIDVEGKAQIESVMEEVVTQYDASHHTEDPSPPAATGGQEDGYDVGN